MVDELEKPGVEASAGSAVFAEPCAVEHRVAEHPFCEQREAASSVTNSVSFLPASSLGRAYLDFMRRDNLSAEFLVEVSAASAGAAPVDADSDYIGRRLRDTHDLWHVLTGYRGDLLGEAALLTFTFAQTHNFGIGVVAAVAALRADEPDARRLLLDAFARGARAAWLPAVAWEELLSIDLGQVRDQLRVGAPPVYEPFFARDLPPGGIFARQAA